jgi:hypothetical protein
MADASQRIVSYRPCSVAVDDHVTGISNGQPLMSRMFGLEVGNSLPNGKFCIWRRVVRYVGGLKGL